MATARDADMIIDFATWWKGSPARLAANPDWEIMVDGHLAWHTNPANESPWLEEAKQLKAVRDTRNLHTGLIPVIGAGVGAPIGAAVAYLLGEPLGPVVSEAVGAVLGGALGGGIGLLTGLGIIPVPQIPSLGAAPEGPGAPARLGKYLITG